jgi:hypothetical protein
MTSSSAISLLERPEHASLATSASLWVSPFPFCRFLRRLIYFIYTFYLSNPAENKNTTIDESW